MERQMDQQKNCDKSTIFGAQEVLAILNAVPQAFFLMKPDCTVIIANDAMASRLHLPPEAIQGMEAFELDPPDMARNRREMVHLVMATGQPVTFTDEQDGQVFENRICPLLNRAEEVSRIAFLSWDITRRTRREMALQQSQMLLNESQKLTHAGGWEWDITARTMTWTDETYRIHGYSPDQYPQGSADLMQHSLKCYDPEDRPVIEEAFHQCAVEGRPYDLTVPFTKADGRRLWIRTIGIPIRDQGKIIKVIGNIVDITDQKQMTNVLQARLRLREAAAMLPLEKLLQKFLDEAEVLTGSSIGFFHFFDHDRETISLQTWSSNTLRFCQAEGKGLHYNLDASGVWSDCIREQRPIIHNDYTTLPNRRGLPPGHTPVIRELVVPIFREGRIVAAFGVGNKETAYEDRDVEIISTLGDMAWDIVLRKKDEEVLRESEARNRHLQKVESLGRMAGAIAHHFNNQLYVVTGNLEMAMADLRMGVDTTDCLVAALHAAHRAADVCKKMRPIWARNSSNINLSTWPTPAVKASLCCRPLFRGAFFSKPIFRPQDPSSARISTRYNSSC